MNFLRTHSKKFMAFFGVILMLAFVVPYTGGSAGNDTTALVGKIGDERVTREQVRSAEEGWGVVAQRVQIRRRDPRSSQEQWVPLAYLAVGPQAFESLRNDATDYYLLLAEARKLGLLPNPEDARQLLNNPEVAILMPGGARVDFANAGDDALRNGLLYHVGNFLSVVGGVQRAVDAAKISKPLVRTEILSEMQTIKSHVVDISAKDLKASVPPPTSQQVQELFDQYGDQEAGNFGTQNPNGFGYKYPNRVKVQYTLVPLGQCTAAVRGGKSDYDWEVEAYKYYDKHQYEYPATQPAGPAASNDFVTTRPASQANGPTTKPFVEVKDQVIESLIQPAAAKLQRQIAGEVQARMETDLAQKIEVGQFEYLQKIAADITAKYKVAPTIVAINDSFKSAAELRLLPNIGRVPSFPDFATSQAEPFLSEGQRGKPGALALNQPSRPASDEASNLYIYQVTAAEPAHKPASLDEVREQVTKDWITAQAMIAARKQADALLAAAAKSGLKSAAESAGRPVVLTGPYGRIGNPSIPDYSLRPRAQAQFVSQSYGLLGKINNASGEKPIAIVELPGEEKVAVVEVVSVESRLPADNLDAFDQFVSSQMQQRYQQVVTADWFQHDSIVTRMNFKEAGEPRPKPIEKPEPAPPAMPPLGS